jgi:hypothetical protein
MSRPMTYPMGDISAGETVTMPAANRGDAKRISRNVSPIRHPQREGVQVPHNQRRYIHH